MQLFMDCELDQHGHPVAFHVFETDDAVQPGAVSPVDNKTPMSRLQVLAYYNAHPEIHAQAGYADVSKIPGLPQGTTRWQALVNHANDTTKATPEVLALKLTNAPVVPAV
jgi:hypothetical protein